MSGTYKVAGDRLDLVFAIMVNHVNWQHQHYAFLLFSAILEVMVLPLQEKKEEWKTKVLQLDKEHAKGEISMI